MPLNIITKLENKILFSSSEKSTSHKNSSLNQIFDKKINESLIIM